MKKKSLAQAIFLVLAVAGWGLYDYLRLPAYNLRSFETWIAAAAALAALVLVFGLFGPAKKAVPASLIAFAIVVAVAFALRLGDFEFWPGNAARLAAQLEAEEGSIGNFSGDFAADSADREDDGPFILSALDAEEADRTAAKAAGELGKQFALGTPYASDLLARREGRWRALRVTPIEYSGNWEALARGAKGTPGFIEVDLEEGTARMVGTEGGLKYGPGAILAYDLMRRVRSRERTALLGDFHFEIDDSGKPRWIVQILKPETGLFGGTDTDGIAIVDAASGTVDRYREGEEPDWVDRVLSFDQAARMAANGARVKNGWDKRNFGGAKAVLALSPGYGRILSRGSKEARSWISVGIAKPGADGLVGMALVDLKAKRARLYAMGGVDELEAMEAAQSEEGSKGKGLTASWPLVASVSGRPAYFMVMRNSAERRYAFVDYASGAQVAVADTVAEARERAKALMGAGRGPGAPAAPIQEIEPAASPIGPSSPGTSPSKEARSASPDPGKARTDAGQGAAARITVLRVKESEGNALFIAQGDPETLYVAPIGLSNGVRFLKAGDQVELRYRLSADGKEREVIELTNLSLE